MGLEFGSGSMVVITIRASAPEDMTTIFVLPDFRDWMLP